MNLLGIEYHRGKGSGNIGLRNERRSGNAQRRQADNERSKNGVQFTTEPNFAAGGVAFYDGKAGNPSEIEAKQWIDAVINDTDPCVLPEQAYCVTRILEGIYILRRPEQYIILKTDCKSKCDNFGGIIMKLCVLANLYGNKTLDEALAKLKSLGVEAVELGAGGYPGKAHCNPAELLADEKKLEEFKATVAKYGMEIAALAAHGNPVHPDKKTAKSMTTISVTPFFLRKSSESIP